MRLMIPPPVLGALLAGAAAGVAHLSPELRLSALPLRGPLALTLGGVGLGIELVCVLAFLRAKTTVTPLRPEKASSLVTGGLYRFSRNPMYLGMAVLLTGWAAWLAHPAGVAGVLGFVWWITRFQIAPEERALSALFGADYEAYCRKVRRWI